MSGQPSSDATLASRVKELLGLCGYMELTFLSVSVTERTVTLEGTVGSYYLKQVAQTIVMAMDEVASVENAIQVVN